IVTIEKIFGLFNSLGNFFFGLSEQFFSFTLSLTSLVTSDFAFSLFQVTADFLFHAIIFRIEIFVHNCLLYIMNLFTISLYVIWQRNCIITILFNSLTRQKEQRQALGLVVAQYLK